MVCAFGGDGTVNESANGLAGSRTALTCLPGGNNNVVAKLLGIPIDVVDATEHLLGMADRWEPRAVDLGVVNGRYFTFAAGMGLDASVVERVDRNPRLKSRFGPFYFVESAIATFLLALRRQPAAAVGRGRRANGRGRELLRPERRLLHVLQHAAGGAGRGRALGLGRPVRRGADPRAALRRADRDLPRALGRGEDRGAPRDRGVPGLPPRRSCARPTTARSRSRSTATTCSTRSRRASRSSRAFCASSRRASPTAAHRLPRCIKAHVRWIILT